MSVADNKIRRAMPHVSKAVCERLAEIAGESYGYALIVFPLNREGRSCLQHNTADEQLAEILRIYADALDGRGAIIQGPASSARH